MPSSHRNDEKRAVGQADPGRSVRNGHGVEQEKNVSGFGGWHCFDDGIIRDARECRSRC